MGDVDSRFTGSIPDIYDNHLVPLIFEKYAGDLARVVAKCKPMHVLEVAAGSGVLTRALAPLLDPASTYHVTDLNSPMLDRAQSMQRSDDRIVWQQADVSALPFDDGTFDAVCCQFSVMFFPDKPLAHAEARRVLRPGGRYCFNIWDRIESNVFADIVTRAVSTLSPDDPADFMARTPHGHHDLNQIAEDLRAGGFKDFSIDTVEHVSHAKDAFEPAYAYCQGTPLRHDLEARGIDLERATELAREALVERYGEGPFSDRIQAHVVTATA